MTASRLIRRQLAVISLALYFGACSSHGASDDWCPPAAEAGDTEVTVQLAGGLSTPTRRLREAFAEERKQDSSKQGTYSLGSNNCATFCEDVLKAGGEKLDVSVVNTPDNVMQELQDRADFNVHYDPKKDELTVMCREGATCPP
jgi:hypothetical protein